MTRNGPEPVENAGARPDYAHYRERQLAPAADGILRFVNTSFATLTDSQLDFFDLSSVADQAGHGPPAPRSLPACDSAHRNTEWRM